MIRIINIYVLISLISIISINCNSLQSPEPDSIEFIEKDQVRFYKYNDKKNKLFIEEILAFQGKHESFIANFSIRIDRITPKKESFNADGKIWFLKETGQVKIQLMDNFFGLVFSEVLATSDEIQVKTSQDEKIHKQKMGDLMLYDPGKKKPIVLPFPVIYYYITGEYNKEFQNNPTFMNSEARRVQVKKKEDLFEYFFDKDGLSALEWSSTNKGVKAISIPNGKRTIPIESLLTKIVEVEQDKEQVIIQTKMRSIQKKSPSSSVFTL
jgi:hypothetical protein